MILYINTSGGAAVGTSSLVTATLKPDWAERQVMYSDYEPSLLALRWEAHGFELTTLGGQMAFNDSEIVALRATPRNLAEAVR